jgi:hypothetical protein
VYLVYAVFVGFFLTIFHFHYFFYFITVFSFSLLVYTEFTFLDDDTKKKLLDSHGHFTLGAEGETSHKQCTFFSNNFF